MKEKWDQVKELALANKIDDIESEIYVKHYSALKKIASDARNRILPENLHWEDGATPNEWIYGPTGTGSNLTLSFFLRIKFTFR